MTMEQVIAEGMSSDKTLYALDKFWQVAPDAMFVIGRGGSGIEMNDAGVGGEIDHGWQTGILSPGIHINRNIVLPQMTAQLTDIHVHPTSLASAQSRQW